MSSSSTRASSTARSWWPISTSNRTSVAPDDPLDPKAGDEALIEVAVDIERDSAREHVANALDPDRVQDVGELFRRRAVRVDQALEFVDEALVGHPAAGGSDCEHLAKRVTDIGQGGRQKRSDGGAEKRLGQDQEAARPNRRRR